MYLNRVPMERGTQSPEPLVCLFMYVCQGPPQKRAHLQKGENPKVSVHGAQRRQKACIQWGGAWFPNQIIYNTAISTSVPCSLQDDTFHLDLGRAEPRQPVCVVATLIRLYPPQLLPLPI